MIIELDLKYFAKYMTCAPTSYIILPQPRLMIIVEVAISAAYVYPAEIKLCMRKKGLGEFFWGGV